MIKLIDSEFDINFNADGSGVIKHTQQIPQAFIDECRQTHAASGEKAKDYHQVARIPTILADQWLAEGFDVFRESAKAIVARLKGQNLDYFVTTTKSL